MPVLKVKKNGVWEEVSGGSSVEVDASLSVEGQAADAKAVGDALAEKQPLGNYASASDVEELNTKVGDKTVSEQISTAIEGLAAESYVDDAISSIPTPDVSGQISAHNTASDAHSDIRNAIPTKVSELTNDSGFISGYTETDPTVPAWAKAANKPSYTASEVGADASGSANAALDSAKSYIDSEIAEWVGDTKVSEQISAAINPLSSEIVNKANKADIATTASLGISNSAATYIKISDFGSWGTGAWYQKGFAMLITSRAGEMVWVAVSSDDSNTNAKAIRLLNTYSKINAIYYSPSESAIYVKAIAWCNNINAHLISNINGDYVPTITNVGDSGLASDAVQIQITELGASSGSTNIGDSTRTLALTGSATNPTYNGANVALQSDIPTSMTPTAHNQAASIITAGTLAGRVVANASATATVGTAQVRNIYAGTSDMTAGSSSLTTGAIYFVYE